MFDSTDEKVLWHPRVLRTLLEKKLRASRTQEGYEVVRENNPLPDSLTHVSRALAARSFGFPSEIRTGNKRVNRFRSEPSPRPTKFR
jgi:hypothetical protein